MNNSEEEKILLFLKEFAESRVFQQTLAGAVNLAEARREVEKRGFAFGLAEFREIMLKTFYYISSIDKQSVYTNISSKPYKDDIFEMLEYSAEFGVPVKMIPLKVFCFFFGD